MSEHNAERNVVRDLAKQYAEIASKPIQEERRELWKAHFSLRRTPRPPIEVHMGPWNAWCGDMFSDKNMTCTDPFYRNIEKWLRIDIFHDTVGDDHICEPWFRTFARRSHNGGIFGEAWGAPFKKTFPDQAHGSWIADYFIKDWDDITKLKAPPHEVDEEATASHKERVEDAIGDILDVYVERGPILSYFGGDISTTIAALRGIEPLMFDMFESPEELHQLLAFLRDGILANQTQAEEAGDYSSITQENQAMPYADETAPPKVDGVSRKRRELWAACAAQEYTAMSPAFHDEFLFQYQKDIMQHFGLVHYGCCENLTHKIDMLRQLKNLRSIAVSPMANLAECAEQIGQDYAISWRPSPAEMVCAMWNPDHVRKVIRESMAVCRDSHWHINLKDIETLGGDVTRLQKWVRIVRETLD